MLAAAQRAVSFGERSAPPQRHFLCSWRHRPTRLGTAWRQGPYLLLPWTPAISDTAIPASAIKMESDIQDESRRRSPPRRQCRAPLPVVVALISAMPNPMARSASRADTRPLSPAGARGDHPGEPSSTCTVARTTVARSRAGRRGRAPAAAAERGCDHSELPVR
jgi:hypothetical protein